MANKKLIIETEVKTDQIDSAAAKLGQLKDLGRGLKIQYDIDGKPIDVVIDKSKNLQQQFKLVTAELRRTKEGTAEFQLLSKVQGDLQDGLARTKAKSGDLLTSLQLLPGPIGDFSSKLNGAIALLKTLTSFSLKDLSFQFKETAADIGEIIDNIFGLGKAATDTGKAVAEASDAATTTANTVAEKINTASIAENTKEQTINAGAKLEDAATTQTATLATEKNTLAQLENALAKEKAALATSKDLMAQYNSIVATGGASNATLEQAIANDIESASSRINTLETQKNAAAKTEQAVATNAATSATTRFIAIITSAQAAILGIVTVIAILGVKLYQYVTETNAAEEATKAFKETLVKGATAAEEARNKVLEVGVAFEQAKTGAISKKKALETYNEVLGGTIGKAETLAEAEKLYKDNTENYIKATGLRAQAQELFRIAAQKSAEAITAQEVGFFSFDRRLGESYEDELKRRRQNLTDASTAIRKSATDLLKEAGSLETGFKPKEDKGAGKGADEAYQQLLKELDARIQLEINKENTSRKVLQGLLDEKRKLIIEHDKLTYNQAELLRQENTKKLEAALEEDNKVIQDKIQKREELRVSAIADEEQREMEARADKLYFDKIAKAKELKNEQEYLDAVKNLEIVFERDILAIRDKYFQKKFKQQQEAQLKENQLYTQGKELEAKVNQQRLDDGIKFNELYGDFIFGDKGLKAMLEKRFIDLRQVYNEEYNANEEQFRKDEEQLKVNLDNKKITQETYDTEVKNIADKRVQNAQTNTEKQIQLDKLEVDSKRASADMTIQIGQNLSSLIGAIAGKNIKLQKAAAILDAGVSIARIITDTSRAIIAFSASVAPLGPAGVPIAAGYAVKSKIAAGLAIGTIIAQGIGKLKSIDENAVSDSGPAQGTSSTTRGMEKGGMINGNRHSRGGVMINAEDGEAVMTRGAVSLFGPMLSMMNQAGGGASFNSNLLTTRQDKPVVSTPSVDDKPIIVKTYMVERELTSYQNKQARLKDLSTL